MIFELEDIRARNAVQTYTVFNGAKLVSSQKFTDMNAYGEMQITKNLYELISNEVMIECKWQIENSPNISTGEYEIIWEVDGKVLIPKRIISLKFIEIKKNNNITVMETGNWKLESYSYEQYDCESKKETYIVEFTDKAKEKIKLYTKGWRIALL